jgi:hypothetical protein
MTDQKPARRPSTASTIFTGIILILVFGALFIPLGIWLARGALGGW